MAARRVIAGLISASFLAGAAAGCATGGDPVTVSTASPPAKVSPTTTPTEPTDPAEALREENVEAAKALIVDYTHQTSVVANNGSKDWADLAVFWGTDDVAAALTALYRGMAESGNYTTGSDVVTSQTVTEYDGTAGRESVRLDVCIDSADVQGFDRSGVEIPSKTPPPRRVDFLVVHQKGSHWTIDELNETGEWC